MKTPRLHPETIEEVKQRADVVDVISESVVLRKRGKDYVGLCPFHQEKTPSFTVSPSKQMYYCFGCGASGNAIKFLMEVGKQSFSEVVLDLARRYQVSVRSLEPEQRQQLQRQISEQEQLYEILALAASFYKHALRQPQGLVALKYLQSQRLLSEAMIQEFQLGYAPSGWDTLYRYLVEQKGKPVGHVEQVGLIKLRKSGNGYYDYFRDRLMIPICDTRGRVIGFGGRSLGEQQPKYLNSPETKLFDKSKILFALDKAYGAISKQDQAVIVEGYFDAIALHAVGIKHVVAPLGTALSQEQVLQLLRYTESKQIVLNFDADAAGTKAFERAIEKIYPLVYGGKVQLRTLNLPDGKDADEFLKEHADSADKYWQLLKEAPFWLDWKIEQLLGGQNLQDVSQFQRVAQEMVKLISKLDHPNTRNYYISRCAQLLSRGDAQDLKQLQENLNSQVSKYRKWKLKGSENTNLPQSFQLLPTTSESNLLEPAEASLLRIYIYCPEYRAQIIRILEEQDLLFSLSHHRFLWQKILELQDSAKEGQNDTVESLISLLQDLSIEFPEQMKKVAHFFHLDEIHFEDFSRTPLVIRAAAACLEQVAYQKRRQYCLKQWEKLDYVADFRAKQYYWQQLYEAERRLKELEPIRRASLSDLV
ncbi:MAG: DNA primase [Symploca sp. SIO2E9]|nr:DNA primase [Symploca sp. SIO2E9]